MESVCDRCVLVKKVNCTFMFEFVLLCLCVYVSLFVCVFVHLLARMRACVCVCVSVCVSVCVCVCLVVMWGSGIADLNIFLAIFILPREKTIVPMYSHTDQHYFKTHEFCSNSQKQSKSSICMLF